MCVVYRFSCTQTVQTKSTTQRYQFYTHKHESTPLPPVSFPSKEHRYRGIYLCVFYFPRWMNNKKKILFTIYAKSIAKVPTNQPASQKQHFYNMSVPVVVH